MICRYFYPLILDVYFHRELMQFDILDLSNLQEFNNSQKYMLVLQWINLNNRIIIVIFLYDMLGWY